VSMAKWMQNHHRSILFVLVVLALAGAASSFFMPVSLFPQVTFPRVVLSVDAGDRPAERMTVEVTRKIEEAVRAVPGVTNIRSTTTRGSADISINFKWGTDMISAMLQVESAMTQVVGELPPGTRFTVRRMDPTVFPVLGFSLRSRTRSQVELKDIALYQFRPLISTVKGVAKVVVLGGDEAEFQVTVDPAKLASYGFTLNELARKLGDSNILQAVGRLEENYKLYLVMSKTRLHQLDQINSLVIRSNDSGVVRLEDVATVRMTTVPRWNRVTADGQDAVLFRVYQQPDGNTIQIAKDVKSKLENIQGHLPKDVKISNWYDQSELILASAGSVRDALLMGVILAILVLFLFLRNVRITFIAAVTVPVVLATTILMLKVLGMSFNIMTLGGMSAAVALIIDDSIVMIEHVMRTLQGGTGHYRERIQRAVVEFTRPLAGSSASTIIIFLPLAFLTGVTGAFFKALSLTMAVALIVSFLVAWLAVPLIALHLMRQEDTKEKEPGAIAVGFQNAYAHLMKRLLSRPSGILLILLPFLFAGYLAYRHVGSGFMPSMDEGGFILDYRAPSGTSLSETDRLLRQVEHILEKAPDVSTYSRRTGLCLADYITEANEGDFFVRLKPFPRRPLDVVMDDVRKQVTHQVPGLEIEMAKLMEDLIGDLTAVPQPIEIKLYSDDSQLLGQLAPRVAVRIEKIPGVVDVFDGIVPAGDALNIRVNLIKASIEGITPADVTAALEAYETGIVATSFQEGPKMVGIRVWVPKTDRDRISGIRNIKIRGAGGHLVPLKRIVTLTPEMGQPQITRDNLKRMVAVTGRISGRDMGSTVQDVIRALHEPGLVPSSVFVQMGGMYEQQQIAFKGLIAVFLAAIALVFALLLYLYESFRVAISMMVTALIAVAAVFIGLWLTGTDLNITAMMGMTMIIGIVTEVSIFYYSEFHDLDMSLSLGERMIVAGKNRARPIAMTTLAAILALSPLALGLGEGAAMLQPLAIAIVSGLMVQFPLVLVGLPTFLFLLSSEKN